MCGWLLYLVRKARGEGSQCVAGYCTWSGKLGERVHSVWLATVPGQES